MNKFVFMSLLLAASIAVAGPLAKIGVDPQLVTVSGISAGAQMAHQMHIAYPEVFSGAGMIAGGPFGCAGGSLGTAMTRCMGQTGGELPVDEFANEIRTAAADGRLGDVTMLANDQVWMFHGALDTIVAEGLSEATVALYEEFLPASNIRYVSDVEAVHNFPTKGQGSACTVSESPYIADCDFDAAGELLQYLYGDLKAPVDHVPASLVTTDLPGAADAGLLETAYLYTPAACSNVKQSCKAHLVLHGCAQSSAQVGTAFMDMSGYLPWAEANDIVLAFPQVAPAAANPIACWDWWGYTGAAYRWREGAQMKVLADWMQTLAKP